MKKDFEAWGELWDRVGRLRTALVAIAAVVGLLYGMGCVLEARLITLEWKVTSIQDELALHKARPHAVIELLRTEDCHPCGIGHFEGHEGMGIDRIFKMTWQAAGEKVPVNIVFAKHEVVDGMKDPCITHPHGGCGGMVAIFAQGTVDECDRPEDHASLDRPCPDADAPPPLEVSSHNVSPSWAGNGGIPTQFHQFHPTDDCADGR